jgi:hypothetical protein
MSIPSRLDDGFKLWMMPPTLDARFKLFLMILTPNVGGGNEDGVDGDLVPEITCGDDWNLESSREFREHLG